MISTQRVGGQLVGRDPRPDAVVEDLGRGARSRPETALEQVVEHRLRRAARALAHVMDLHRRVGMQVDLGRHVLDQPQPATVVLERVVGVDAALHADLRRPVVDRLLDAGLEVVLGHVVGVGRAAALAEAAEGAPDHADVGEVDVAIDDERHPLAGKLRPKPVGRRAHLLDHLGSGLGEQGRDLILGQRLAATPLLDRPWRGLGGDRPVVPPPGALARNEAPVLELHHVEDTLLHPARVQVLRIGAQPLGERVTGGLKALSDLVRAREGVLGRDVVAVGRQPTEVRGALFHELVPPVREVRRDLDPHLGHQPPALAARGASCRRA